MRYFRIVHCLTHSALNYLNLPHNVHLSCSSSTLCIVHCNTLYYIPLGEWPRQCASLLLQFHILHCTTFYIVIHCNILYYIVRCTLYYISPKLREWPDDVHLSCSSSTFSAFSSSCYAVQTA